MMRKRFDIIRFALKCVLIPAAAMFLIYLMNKPYKAIDEQKYQDILKFDMLGRNYWEVHIGNLGSSHGAYEFGQYMVDGSVLFIPVSYFSFNNEVVNRSEAEAMSVRYYHFLSPENIPDYDPYVDIITNRLPILSAGEDILKLFPNLSPVLTAHAANEGIDVEEFARRAGERYSRHFDKKEEYFMPERIEELRAIIAYCQEHEITPVLITTPFSKYYTDLVSQEFLQEFRETVFGIASDTGVVYYDYSFDERFRENLQYFSDSDHLNPEGAAYFMSILWNELPEMKRFQ